MKKILIIDYDRTVTELLKSHLEKDGYVVIVSTDGNEAMVKYQVLNPDIVVTEVHVPGKDGWQICREIRKENETPLIFITSKSEIFDKLLGFDIGADDYIVKPFDVREAVARIKAVARRACVEKSEKDAKELNYDNMYINLTRYIVKVDDKQIFMPPKEIELLYFLASNPNRVFTRDQLLDEVWGFEYYGDSRTIDVHIKRIRKKLSGASDKWQITTVWGVGYKFESEQL